jgi:hypothetical protein
MFEDTEDIQVEEWLKNEYIATIDTPTDEITQEILNAACDGSPNPGNLIIDDNDVNWVYGVSGVDVQTNEEKYEWKREDQVGTIPLMTEDVTDEALYARLIALNKYRLVGATLIDEEGVFWTYNTYYKGIFKWDDIGSLTDDTATNGRVGTVVGNNNLPFYMQVVDDLGHMQLNSSIIDPETHLPKILKTDSDLMDIVKKYDGTGSGLDADLFDGINSDRFIYGGTNGTINVSDVFAQTKAGFYYAPMGTANTPEYGTFSYISTGDAIIGVTNGMSGIRSLYYITRPFSSDRWRKVDADDYLLKDGSNATFLNLSEAAKKSLYNMYFRVKEHETTNTIGKINFLTNTSTPINGYTIPGTASQDWLVDITAYKQDGTVNFNSCYQGIYAGGTPLTTTYQILDPDDITETNMLTLGSIVVGSVTMIKDGL